MTEYYAFVNLGRWDGKEFIGGVTSAVEQVVNSEGFLIRFVEISKHEYDSYDDWVEDEENPIYKDVLTRRRLKPVKTISLEDDEEFAKKLRVDYQESNHSERRAALEAEIAYMEEMISNVPAEKVIYIGSLNSLLEELKEELRMENFSEASKKAIKAVFAENKRSEIIEWQKEDEEEEAFWQTEAGKRLCVDAEENKE